MKGTTHVHYELLRALRSWRTLFLSFALPLVVYCVIVPANRHAVTDGIPFPLYFMTGMAAYGAMWGSINPGARIARDRAKGWVRALRITPLRVRTEIVAKVLTAYLIALLTLALLYLAGALFGVRLDAAQWFEMTGLLLVGLAPFVAAGIALGHVRQRRRPPRGNGRVRRPPRPPRRRLRPALHLGRHAHDREAASLLLARPRRQDSRRKRELARRGLDRRRSLDPVLDPSCRSRLPA